MEMENDVVALVIFKISFIIQFVAFYRCKSIFRHSVNFENSPSHFKLQKSHFLVTYAQSFHNYSNKFSSYKTKYFLEIFRLAVEKYFSIYSNANL